LVVVAAIHLLPLAGVLGGAKLSALYGVPIDDPNLQILMRHRAVLFGLLGAFMLWAAFVPSYQPAALLAGWVSVVAFLVLAHSTGGYNAPLARVVAADWVALAFLVAGSVGWEAVGATRSQS
jgi:hypothetical protein